MRKGRLFHPTLPKLSCKAGVKFFVISALYPGFIPAIKPNDQDHSGLGTLSLMEDQSDLDKTSTIIITLECLKRPCDNP